MEVNMPNSEPHGGSSDFYIRIMFRQNASWQGEILWIKTNEKRYFRSSLELTMLIQEAMDVTHSPTEELRIRSWQHKEETISP